MYLSQIGIDCNITLEGSRLSTSCIMTMIPRSILQHMFELLNFSHLLSFHLFVASTALCISQSPIFPYSNHRSLIRFHSTILEASKILLLDHFWLPFQVPLRCLGRSSLLTERPVQDGCRWTFLQNLLSTSSSSDL